MIIMNSLLKLEAPWEQVKELLKEVNTSLTDEDLAYEEGNEQALLQHLAKKMGRSPDEVRVWIESVSHNKGMAS